MAFLYIIVCQDGTYYTGIAKDIEVRLREHREKGKACAKYTRAHPIKALLALWQTDTLANAAKGEYAIKKLSRKKKEALIADAEQLLSFCPGLTGLPFTVRRDMILADRENWSES
ncbi:MAG TPA: GIY-YIG nuclease family protein [Clostridiales bacterium]|nr:GIY-YIG nuclease family protein [Clostridiales bacterium]